MFSPHLTSDLKIILRKKFIIFLYAEVFCQRHTDTESIGSSNLITQFSIPNDTKKLKA